MRRALEAVAVAGLAAAALTLALRDPGEPFAIAMFVVAVGISVAAGSARLLLTGAAGGRSAKARAQRQQAVRRGMGAGAVVAILLALRAADGLNLFTAGFALLAFALAEVALTTRSPGVR